MRALPRPVSGSMWARCMRPLWRASIRPRAAAAASAAGTASNSAADPRRAPARAATATNAPAASATSRTAVGTPRAWRESEAATGDITLPPFYRARRTPLCIESGWSALNVATERPISRRSDALVRGPRPPAVLARRLRRHPRRGRPLGAGRPGRHHQAPAARPSGPGRPCAHAPGSAQRVVAPRAVVAGPHGPHEAAAGGEARAVLERPLRDRGPGHAADAGPEPDAARPRAGLVPQAARRGHARPGDAAVPLPGRLDQGRAQRELRARA